MNSELSTFPCCVKALEGPAMKVSYDPKTDTLSFILKEGVPVRFFGLRLVVPPFPDSGLSETPPETKDRTGTQKARFELLPQAV